jgi:hypothetical protein
MSERVRHAWCSTAAPPTTGAAPTTDAAGPASAAGDFCEAGPGVDRALNAGDDGPDAEAIEQAVQAAEEAAPPELAEPVATAR